MPEVLDNTVGYQPLTPQEEKRIYAPDQLWSDDFALKVCVQDFNKAEAYRTANHDWRWQTHDELYQGWVTKKFWEGTRYERASLPIYLCFEQIESMLPKILSAIFSDNPWFQSEAEPGTNAEEARQVRDMIRGQLDQTRVREIFRRWIKSGLQYGNGIMKLCWLNQQKKSVRFVPRFEQAFKTLPIMNPATGQPFQMPAGFRRVLDKKEYIEIENRPELKFVSIKDFYIDPNCSSPQPQDGGYCHERTLLTLAQCEALREHEEFNIPPKEMLIRMAQTKPSAQADNTKQTAETWRSGSWSPQIDQTVDPGGLTIEAIERWSEDRQVIVFNREWLAYNQPNPFGFIPYYNFPYADILDRFYAMGMCDVLEGEQRFRVALRNGRVDEIALNLHKPMIKKRGLTTPAYMMRVRPGQIWEADNPKEDYQFPEMPNVLTNAYIEDQYSQLEAQKITGMSDLAVLGTPSAGGNSASRTATGVGVQAQASFSRIQYIVENAEDMGIEPMLRDVEILNKLYPPIGSVPVPGEDGAMSMLSPEVIINSNVKFKMRASAKMAARLSLQQSFPLVAQTLMNPEMLQYLAKQGKTVDFEEMIRMVLDMTGYRNRADLIRALSPEEMKMLAQPSTEETIKTQMQKERLASQEKTTTQKLTADQEMESERLSNELMRTVVTGAMKLVSDQEKAEGQKDKLNAKTAR